MKKLTSALTLIFLSSFLFAQSEIPKFEDLSDGSSKTHISLYGGLSLPLSNYKGDIGRAELGHIFGFGIDHYFKGKGLGIGIDFRYFQHNTRKFDMDTFHFATGFRSMEVTNKNFKNFALSIGPSYQFSSKKIDIEAFVRGGILFQHFPEFQQRLFITDMGTGQFVEALRPYHSDNIINNPKSWMGLIGAKFTYKLSPNLGVFLQGDYLRGFGENLGEGKSGFYVATNNVIKEISEPDKIYIREDFNNVDEFYSLEKTIEQTFVQAFNISLGLRFSFGGKKKAPSKDGGGGAGLMEKSDKEREILIVVKDKRTGLALSGVKVKVSGEGLGEYISITNSNGESDRISNPKPGAYLISGDKNGIPTTTATIDAAEFEKSTGLIYKEIFHDDERFTLRGQTMECETESTIAGIETLLTNAKNQKVLSQISDKEGNFVFQLDQNSNYTVIANQSGKYSQTELVSTKGLDREKTLYVTLKLGVCPIEEGKSFVLKNILYDFDQSAIRSDAARVLDNLVNVLKENPSMHIELSSHTDSRGNDQYNQRLSQRRAQSAVSYLISKGIQSRRITAKGYGESRLINECSNGVNCSEEKHEQNRRTEIKVLKF